MKEELLQEFVTAIVRAQERCETEHKISPDEFMEFLRNPRGPHSNSYATLGECLAPILAEHDAETVVVSREALELICKLDEQRSGNHPHGVCTINTEGGSIVDARNKNLIFYGTGKPHKTAEAAIESLLKPPEPKSKECGKCGGPLAVTLMLSGCSDPTGSMLLWKGQEFTIIRKPKE